MKRSAQQQELPALHLKGRLPDTSLPQKNLQNAEACSPAGWTHMLCELAFIELQQQVQILESMSKQSNTCCRPDFRAETTGSHSFSTSCRLAKSSLLHIHFLRLLLLASNLCTRAPGCKD